MNTAVASRPDESAVVDQPIVRRRWTHDEVLRAVAAGIIHEDEPIELIEGDLVVMSPKGRFHEVLRDALVRRWFKIIPDDVYLSVEPGLQLEGHSTPEPDIMLFPASLVSPDVRGDTALLVVEVSDTSYGYDIRVKGPLYARYGVREYWVIEPRSLKTTIHRDPQPDGYKDVAEHDRDALLTPLLVPALAIRLADLGPVG